MRSKKACILYARRVVVVVLCAIMVFAATLSSVTTRAQDESSPRTQSSELAKQNLSRVAASAGEIKPVLLKDGGLMVELKRWVAKDATDHGQIITDADLTNDSIFDRLENDVQFRAVATLLLQTYGYLVPQVNPNSEMGREQVLLLQQRAAWITQAEAARQQQQFQAGSLSCRGTGEVNCAQGRNTTQSETEQPQQSQPQTPLKSLPNSPGGLRAPGQSPNPLETAQLMQAAGGNEAANFSDLGLGESSNASSVGVSSVPGTFRQQLHNGGNVGTQQPEFGYLGGADLGGVLDQNDINPFETKSISDYRRSVTKAQRQNGETAAVNTPQMVRMPNPYQNIPSLYDMYMQATSRPVTPHRFGMDVFQNGAQDPNLIPMDLPSGPDYVVGPGDGLAIDLWGGISRKIYRTVDREGRISVPEVGPLLVTGKSLMEVQEDLQQLVRTQFRDESADVSLARLRTIRVYEVGDVTNPGAYDISSLSTTLNALFAAGGPTPQGSLRYVKHYRNNQLIETVDVYDLLLHGVRTGMQRLDNGDTILVPPLGSQITIEGMVRRPAIYELKDERNLASVLELAGGLLPAAAIRHIEVERLVAHEKQTMLSLNIPDVGDASEVAEKLQMFEVQDGDRVRIFPIASGNQDAVYLEGHVLSPGRYSYHSNMHVTDVIGSYKDLLPEPAGGYAEIIRLNEPDFHPSVQSFNLAEALANPSQAPVLKPMDTVRIFGRFDFENPPSVSVLGDVRAPGTYQTSGEIHIADAIHLAGGTTPDAQTEDVQVFRYLPDGKSRIFSVSLSQALEGNPIDNIILQPRDRLLVHKNLDTAEPAVVSIQGEVGKPGRYPLATNMRVADLIRVGGGLKPSADKEVADIVHYGWAEQNRLSGQNEKISLAPALAGDPRSNVPLHNGDVVTVGQLPGWNDLGSSVLVKGEVKHAGTYGVQPGEKLSSVLERAGGFQPGAYPYGAVLERTQVRELEAKQQNELILRVKEAESNLELTPAGNPQQAQAREMTLQQYQTTLTELTSNPPIGRVAIRISSNMGRWKNTSADLEVRAGDVLVIPKKPSYVMVAGQVFSPTAVSYRPGKSAKWYLSQSGGPTQLANKKAIFVLRADGSVIGAKDSLLVGESFSAVLLPGDTVIVPEKAIGGGPNWSVLFTAAQVASSVVSTLFIALHY